MSDDYLGLVFLQPETSRPTQDWIISIIINNKKNLGKHKGYGPVNFQNYTREKVSMEGKVE